MLCQGSSSPRKRRTGQSPSYQGTECLAGIQWDLETVVMEGPNSPTWPGNGPSGRLFVPNTIRSEALQWGHAAPSSGHPGVLRTLRRIQSKVWWPNMGTDVRRMVAACSTCARNKEPRDLPQGKLHPLPIPRRPWSHISMDFVSGLPNSQGNTVILVVDRFSKACHLIPASKIPTAGQTTELLMQHVFRIHGFPQDMVSDRGSQFTSRFWKAFGRLIGSTISLFSGFYPQSNGQTERVNQEIEKTLRCLVSNNPSTWSSQLVWAEFAHNTLHHSSLGMSPFECQFGFPPSLISEQDLKAQVPTAAQLVRRCRGGGGGSGRELGQPC